MQMIASLLHCILYPWKHGSIKNWISNFVLFVSDIETDDSDEFHYDTGDSKSDSDSEMDVDDSDYIPSQEMYSQSSNENYKFSQVSKLFID